MTEFDKEDFLKARNRLKNSLIGLVFCIGLIVLFIITGQFKENTNGVVLTIAGIASLALFFFFFSIIFRIRFVLQRMGRSKGAGWWQLAALLIPFGFGAIIIGLTILNQANKFLENPSNPAPNNSKSNLSFFDGVRIILSFIVAIITYLLAESYFIELIKGWDTVWGLIGRYFLVEGVGVFLAIFLGLILVNKRLKIVTGTIIMLFFIIFYFFSIVLQSFSGWIDFAESVVGLSFASLGASLAILFWMVITARKKEKQSALMPAQNGREKPKPSLFLFLLSILSIPASYLTIVISSFITLGLSLWLLLIVLQMPRIPIVILVAIGLAPLVSMWIAFRALKIIFFSKPSFQSAVKINISAAPKLKAVIDEVCREVKTKIPDVIILHAESTFFVAQGTMNTLDGIVKGRILALGAPLIDQLKMDEFKSILAHEFAHFSGNDTVYSSYVVPTYRSIGSALKDFDDFRGQNTSEGNNVMNLINLLLLIPSIFLNIFLDYFARIDNLLSRSRELRADWIAASIYGSNHFGTALTKVVELGAHYNEFTQNMEINTDNNFFKTYKTILGETRNKLESYREQALKETEKEFDTHPSLTTRLNSLPNKETSDSSQKIEELISEISEDENRLSKMYQDMLLKVKKYYEELEKLVHNQTPPAENPKEE